MEEQPPGSIYLQKMRIPHRVFKHDRRVESLEQAARERGERPEQVIRSILFRLGENEYLMALMAGQAQISWKKLRKHVGQSRLTMASEEEVIEVTGYRIGAVCPFGLPRPLRVLVDPSVLAEEEISLGSGVRGTAIIMSPSELKRALKDAEVVDLLGVD